MERITTPAGITYSYVKSGSGPPLVLVHGSLNNNETAWVMAGPLLQSNFTLYAVARRGRGETTPTEGHSIADEADDLLALLGTISEAVFLLGHSYGALVALAAARLAPHRVRKLVLYEPPLPSALSTRHLQYLEELAAKGDGDAVVDEFLRNVVRFPDDLVDFIRSTPRWQFLVDDVPNSIREWPAMVGYNFKQESFADMRMPVLLLTGDDSPQEIYATEALSTVIPNARTVKFPGQGHIAHLLVPQDFADAVTSFLKEE